MKGSWYLLILAFFAIQHGIFAQNTFELSKEEKQEIEKLDKQILIFQNKGELNLAASSLNKIAYIYWNHNKFDDALKYFLRSVKINEDLGNINGCKTLYNNIAILYSDLNKCNTATKYFKKSLDIAKQFNLKKEQVNSLINIAVSNTNCDKYELSINALDEALVIAQELNDIYLLRNIYGQLAENYEKKGDAEKSFEYFDLFSTFDKHVRDQEKKELEKRQKKQLSAYESRTKQAEEMALLKEKELQLSISELKRTTDSLRMVEEISEQRRQKMEAQEQALIEKEARLKLAAQLRNTIIISFFVLLAFSALLLRQYLQKRKVNKLLEAKNKLLSQQKEEISHQKDKLEEINKELNKKNRQILDSITYAKKIQDAILPYEKSIKKSLPESFIFYRPRDLVSGDFYWYSEQNGKLYLAAVDCTGHGVPGAFMSMIGNTLLNEIINEKKFTQPSKILKKLNDGIVHILNQTEEREEVQDDGMDITLCSIDKKKGKLEIACANHYALVFNNGECQEIKGDIFTIGGIFAIRKEDQFKNHKIDISEGTTVYLLSDGFQDQFGGEDNTKYMTDNLIQLITSIQKHPMDEQRQILSNTLDTWKGSHKQIDDILILGFRCG